MEMTRRFFLKFIAGAGTAAVVVLSSAQRLLAAISWEREHPEDGRTDDGFRWEFPDEEVTGGRGLPRIDRGQF